MIPDHAPPTPIRRRFVTRQWIAACVYAAVLAMPGTVFFSQRGGVSFLSGHDVQTFNLLAFPLIGLYAFTLLWSQFVIGSARSLLGRFLHPGIISFHRRQGVLIFLLALLHPLMRFFGIGLDRYFTGWHVAPSFVPYLWLGYLVLFMMTLTVVSALLRNVPWLRKRWHAVHYLNYAVFAMAWLHSWFLGSDVQSTGLSYLWMFFAASAVAATVVRVVTAARTRSVRTDRSPGADGGYVPVARLEDVRTKPVFCATVNGRRIAVFNVDGSYFALDNACSHAGGPLCEGTLEGRVIECPLHATRFDVTTGAVISGPATQPQRRYDVRVRDGSIEIAL